jgi:hypothetical protein
MGIPRWAKILMALFAGWFIISQPANAATVTRDGWSKVQDAGNSLSTFVTHLDG